MSQLSRRSLVTSAVALPALAPSLANALPVGADAELLRLGAELDRVRKDWLAQRALDRWEEANNIQIDPDLERWGRINDQLFDLGDEILAHKATTLAGLAIQTHAIALLFYEAWADRDCEEDEDQTRRRLYVESVSSFSALLRRRCKRRQIGLRGRRCSHDSQIHKHRGPETERKTPSLVS
jgi:hypothetical protein